MGDCLTTLGGLRNPERHKKRNHPPVDVTIGRKIDALIYFFHYSTGELDVSGY
jgi:hypothetical protein